MELSSPYVLPLALTLLVFCLLWPVSLMRRDASIVDAWWGGGFLAQTALVVYLVDAADPRALILVGLIAIWTVRISWVLIRRRIREGEEDPRYRALRAAWEPGFWWKSLFVVFLLQGLIQWLIALGPISALIAPAEPLGLLAWAGVVVALVGLGLETRADAELDRFKKQNPADALCQSGLRGVIRHPNYVGEILFWIGIAGIVAEAAPWIAAVSPAVIGVFLVFVSGAPMLDERLSESRPDYAAYRARVPGFVPRLTRSSELTPETGRD